MRTGYVCAVAVGLTMLACSGEGATLIVQVRTDLLPAQEFTTAEVTLSAAGREASLDAEDARDWGAGVRIAELSGLPTGTHEAQVGLFDGDTRVLHRPVRVTLSSGDVRVVTVLLTRDCDGVSCPGATDDPDAVACLAGRCVPVECAEERPELCPEPRCESATDCDPGGLASCASAECTASKSCFVSPSHELCLADELCDVTRGCVRVGGGPVEICSNGVDDDMDGAVDCEDTDCVERCFEWRSAGTVCGTALDCPSGDECVTPTYEWYSGAGFCSHTCSVPGGYGAECAEANDGVGVCFGGVYVCYLQCDLDALPPCPEGFGCFDPSSGGQPASIGICLPG